MLMPVPTATHLIRYAGAPAGLRIGIAAQNRAQTNTPHDERPWPMFYRPILRASREFIDAGCTGLAFERCIAMADTRHAPSFRSAAEGLKKIFGNLELVRSAGGCRRAVVGREGPMAKVAFPLRAGSTDGNSYWFFFHFPSKQLTPEQLQVLTDLLACVPHAMLVPPKLVVALPRSGTHFEISQNDLDVKRAQRRLASLLGDYERDWNAA